MERSEFSVDQTYLIHGWKAQSPPANEDFGELIRTNKIKIEPVKESVSLAKANETNDLPWKSFIVIGKKDDCQCIIF